MIYLHPLHPGTLLSVLYYYLMCRPFNLLQLPFVSTMVIKNPGLNGIRMAYDYRCSDVKPAELSSYVAKQTQQHSIQSIHSDLNFLFLKVLVLGALQQLSSLEHRTSDQVILNTGERFASFQINDCVW